MNQTIKQIILEELALDWKFNERKNGDVEVADKIVKRIKLEIEKLEIEKLGLSEEYLVMELLKLSNYDN